MPATKKALPHGRQKLIEQRKQQKAENHEAIRRVLVEAKQPLTVGEIAERVGLNPATVSEAAVELGLYRRKAAHSERGASLLGANPFVYWTDRALPKRTTPIEGKPVATAAPAKPAGKVASPASNGNGSFEQVRELSGGRLLLASTGGDLYVAHQIEI